jgi:hypothetical protein
MDIKALLFWCVENMSFYRPPSPPPAGPRSVPTAEAPDGAGKSSHSLKFNGVVRVYTCDIPDDSIVDLSENGVYSVYVTCWIDSQRGKSAYVSFPNRSHPGTFSLELDVKDGDPEKLKLQLCMRMRDEETGNRRTAELSTSYACLQTMLKGDIDEFIMPDEFSPGNKAQIAISISNAAEFRNYPGMSEDMQKPLLQLVESKIDSIQKFNAHCNMVSAVIGTNNGANRTRMPPGGDAFENGTTW